LLNSFKGYTFWPHYSCDCTPSRFRCYLVSLQKFVYFFWP